MSYWLLKTEPEAYSYDDLVKKGRDTWEGVRNFVALKNIRKMQAGDYTFIYHTGKEKAVVGVAQVVSEPYPDPTQSDERLIIVDVIPKYNLERPVTLKEIKQDPFFSDWELVRQSRLSVMPVPREIWERILEMSNTTFL